ncbi:alpha/beta fold hydrolase [Muricoccus pecuniae]|uniref:Pimeloyl-ACP methyl ester carboxylesterase n=1 Tax=Muricoccus pecuniae TaxID=693023 RepID=A0A840Y7C6_9PROT|nr:alpha/beta hydrolase [Roseomonas pecuniae]MBB5695800.1 pimeloyl-ACP methyl ester carboxylesterase [Roseomonas pecuniae]
MPEICHVASGRAFLVTEAVGEGQPVTFLHSNAGDRREWHGPMGRVGTAHQAIAYDRRGFGETRAVREGHSAVADLMAVLDAVTDGTPAVLVGCSMGGKIALDAALRHPARVRGLVLIAPSVEGAPPPDHPPEIAETVAWAQEAEASGDLDRVAAARARLWLDGPLAPEGRVGGAARRLFLDIIGTALRAPPVGANLDRAPVYGRLGAIAVPTLVIQGNLDFPHIQARSHHIATTVPGGSWHGMAGIAHLPALERPNEVADLVGDFLTGCSG